MIRLDTTARKLELFLAGAVTTNQLQVTVCYSDQTSTTYNGATQLNFSNNTTPVVICTAPPSGSIRDIDLVNVLNTDTASATVNVEIVDGTTSYNQISVVLSAGDKLTYTHGSGWQVVTSDGSLKQQVISTAGVSSVSASTPLASSGGTTPNITIQQASALQSGYLSSTDWSTFNSKGSGSVTSITAGTGLSGGTITGSGTIAIANTAVTAGSYTNASITVNAQGQITAASNGTAPITSITGTSPVNASTVAGATTISLAAAYGDTQNPYASKTANYVLAAPNGSAGVPTFRALVAADIPSLPYAPTAGSTSITTLGTITTGVWNGTAIANGYLANSSITINGTSVSLGGSATITAANPNALTIGTGLSGTSYNGSTAVTIAIANTTVTATSYGSASSVATFTVNAQGQLTAAATTAIAITNTQVSGLGTMSTQNANSVAVTGGTIDGTILGGTTPAAGTFTDVIATGGSYSKTAFGGSYSDGIITDYTTGTGRFTVGSADGFAWRNNGPSSPVSLMTLSTTGGLVAGALDNTPIGGTTAAAGTFTTLTANSTSQFGKSSANYQQLVGTATGLTPVHSVLGSDTNIALAFQSKGTGAIDLAAGSSGVNISNGGTVTAITRTAQGSGYTTVPTWTASAPTTAGGTVASGTTTLTAISATVSNTGSGYTAGDVVTISGGTSTQAITITVNTVTAGAIATYTLTQTGNYSVMPSLPASVTGGTGTGATFNLNMGITSGGFVITNAGSGYVEQPTVSFSGGGGSGAAAYATVGSGTVVKSIGSTLSFYTPNGEGFRVIDSGLSGNYFAARGWSATPSINVEGAGSNVNGSFSSKGTGSLQFNTNASAQLQFQVAHTASAVNYVQVTGAATTASPIVSAQGSDGNIPLRVASKGTQTVTIATNYSGSGTGNAQFSVSHTSNSVNTLNVTGAAAGAAPILSAQGSDTNIDLALTPKGTGNVVASTGSFSGSGSLLTSLNASNLSSGTVGTARLGSGSASGSTFLRGDQTWATVTASAGGSNTQVQYNSSGALAGSANLTFDGTNLTCGGTITANSDETLKTNWRDLPDNFIELMSQVKSGIYDRLDVELTQAGVSAQSLQKVLPQVVLGGDKLSVAYGNAALVLAIELAKEIVELKSKLKG